MDNLPVHKVAGVAEAIEAAGATLIYLPKYSPDLNANSRRICATPPSIQSHASCAGSVALLPISVRRNAETSFACGLRSNMTGIRSNSFQTGKRRHRCAAPDIDENFFGRE